MAGAELGPFEQAVLLSILRESPDAYSLAMRTRLEAESGKPVSRGAFYATVERLAGKGLLEWETVLPPDSTRSTRQRRFAVTPAGLQALRSARDSLEVRWTRLSEALGDS